MPNTTISSGLRVRNRVLKEEQEQIDHLSNLPEHLLLLVLSMLPTPVAARTSLLSSHFLQIWKVFEHTEFWRISLNNNDRDLIRFDKSSYPLVHLDFYPEYGATSERLEFLLRKAQSLSLRHLKVHPITAEHFQHILPIIFSFDHLLSFSIIGELFIGLAFPPSNVSLTHLQSLSLHLYRCDCDSLNEIIARLCSLEEFFIEVSDTDAIKLMSRTVRKLELTSTRVHGLSMRMLRLVMPNLEIFGVIISDGGMPHIWGKMPKLRNAFISNDFVCQSNVPAICHYLRIVMNVETLKLDFVESHNELHPFHMILDPGNEPPIFPHLKSLDVNLCFHDKNIDVLIRLLQNSPAIERLNLTHKSNSWRALAFSARPPRNTDGYERVCFRDLHIGEKRKQLIELLTKKNSSNRRKQ